jgi:hypothetical protein
MTENIYIPNLPTEYAAAGDDVPTVCHVEMLDEPSTQDRILSLHFEDAPPLFGEVEPRRDIYPGRFAVSPREAALSLIDRPHRPR